VNKARASRSRRVCEALQLYRGVPTEVGRHRRDDPRGIFSPLVTTSGDSEPDLTHDVKWTHSDIRVQQRTIEDME
jgi:hypothetical protein